jgi:small subunit ribosomal protein S19e
MVSALEAPADKLILRLARYLKENVDELKPSHWSLYAKTGVDRETPPFQDDWWYIRAASIMRKLYKAGRPLGVGRFRVIYGGRKNRGSRPEHFVRAGGSIPRTILKQLENAGLVARVPGKGRILTPKAVSLMDNIAYEILKEMSSQMPELRKYVE